MLPMPHVLSTETKFETTMGFSHNNRLKSESRAIGSTTAFDAAGASSTSSSSSLSSASQSFESEMSALMQSNQIRLCRQLLVWQIKRRWKQQRLQHRFIRSVPFKSRHNANNQFVSTILCANQKTERGTGRDPLPSGQVCNIRWPNVKLCFSAETANRRPRSACNCLPSVAMARSTLCNRTEKDTIVPKRNRSRLYLLQSDTLVPDMPNRYYSCFISFYFISFLFFTFSLGFNFMYFVSFNLFISHPSLPQTEEKKLPEIIFIIDAKCATILKTTLPDSNVYSFASSLVHLELIFPCSFQLILLTLVLFC